MANIRYEPIVPFTPHPWQLAPWLNRDPVMLLTGGQGGGKAEPLTNEIPTPAGWKTMGDLAVGDFVFDEHGRPTRICAVSDVMTDKEIFEVVFDDGSAVKVAGDHLWLSHTRASRRSKRRNPESVPTVYRLRGSPQQRAEPQLVTTYQIKDNLIDAGSGALNHATTVPDPLCLPPAELPIDPYVLGCWLGDGDTGGAAFTSADPFIIEQISQAGYEVRKLTGKYRYRIASNLQKTLRANGLLGNKSIPPLYLRASYDQRLSLLQGIIDTDGHIDCRGQAEISLSNEQLARDVRELIATLGFKCSFNAGAVKYDGRLFPRFRMKFTPNRPVARLPRKLARISLDKTLRVTHEYRYVVSVTPCPSEPARCIQVENETGLYLTGRSLIVTHNSLLAANKIHAFCLHYPEATALVMRKVRSTMDNSVIASLRTQVIGDDPRVVYRPGLYRFEYTHNKSQILWGGMADEQQRQHIRSIGQHGGVDIVWMEEATQFDEPDYDEVPGRMRGRATDRYYEKMYHDLGDPGRLEEAVYKKHFNADGSPRLVGWRQVILSTNPDSDGHWINIRLIENNEATIFRSSALDNPSNPPDYIERLKRLKGVRYRRLVLGIWCQSDKTVFDTWADRLDATGDHGGNVTYSAEYVPGGGDVVWWVDDGYAGTQDPKTRLFSARSHPRAFLLVQRRTDGTLAIFDENFAIGRQGPEHIKEVLEYSDAQGYARPERVVHDRSAVALAGALRAAGLATSFNAVPVEESIKQTREWVSEDENGVRRLTLHPRCFYTKHQMNSYARNDRTDQIVKQHDDGPDAIRYGIWNEIYGAAPDVQVAMLDSHGNIIAIPLIDPKRPAITVQKFGQTTVAHIEGAAI